MLLPVFLLALLTPGVFSQDALQVQLPRNPEASVSSVAIRSQQEVNDVLDRSAGALKSEFDTRAANDRKAPTLSDTSSAFGFHARFNRVNPELLRLRGSAVALNLATKNLVSAFSADRSDVAVNETREMSLQNRTVQDGPQYGPTSGPDYPQTDRPTNSPSNGPVYPQTDHPTNSPLHSPGYRSANPTYRPANVPSYNPVHTSTKIVADAPAYW